MISIGSDGKIVLTMPYVEMGQGTYTSIPMLIAEELEVDLKQVQVEHAPPNEKLYGNPLLAGVQATRFAIFATFSRHELGIFTSCCKCDIAAQH